MSDQPAVPASRKLRFRDELVDFWRFIRQPNAARLTGRGPGGGVWRDFWPGVRPGRLLAWALLLWCVNLFALGPVAVAAAGLAGPRIGWIPPTSLADRHHLGAAGRGNAVPLRPATAQAGAVAVPGAGARGAVGPRIWTGLLLAAFLLLAVWALIRRAQPLQGWDTTWRRYYLKHFGLVFHLATLTFAAVHLSNFVFSKTPYWLLPAGAAAMAHGSGAGLDAGAQGHRRGHRAARRFQRGADRADLGGDALGAGAAT